MTADTKTVHELLRNSLSKYGERRAIITEDSALTYKQLSSLVDCYARGMIAQGITKGTRVGLLMENRPEWIAMALAATSVGAIFVPINTFSKPMDLAYHLKLCDVSSLFLTDRFLKNDYLAMLLEVLPELRESTPGAIYCESLPYLRQVVALSEGETCAGCLSWNDFEASAAAVPTVLLEKLRAEVDADDECYILSTSGTTSLPKGVPHTQSAVARNGWLIGEYQQLNQQDVTWFYFPLFFSAGCINVMLGTLSHGAALIVQPAFEPGKALELIEREQATAWHLFPNTLQKLMAHTDWSSRDHSSLHKGTVPYDALLDMPSPSGQGGVNMYGMTETCTAFTCTQASDEAAVRINTQGLLMPGNTLKIVDPDTGERVAEGEQGEICVMGPSVMRRYYKLPRNEHFDGEGFLRTGDLGKLDGDGRLIFLQRAKDMIKSGGINISPAEIEEKLKMIDGVQDAFAFPVPDEEKGEVVGLALVVAPDKVIIESQEIGDFCFKNLSSYKRPAGMIFLREDEVPMTGSGKVQKNIIRDQYLNAEQLQQLTRLT